MEDVIFGGTRLRKRQGFAQVSLTLDHCSGMLPDGGDEVTVTRRYYRSGESEYALNGQQVRLRDVNTLFMDTGLGQEGYALIGQGKTPDRRNPLRQEHPAPGNLRGGRGHLPLPPPEGGDRA